MKEEKFNEAINGFIEVADKYPKSIFAPKAWLSRGWILENNLKMYDSAAVVYDSITKKFPNSIYANKISPKLSTYKAEQKRLEAIRDSARIADSLALKEKMRLEKAKQDSISSKSGIQTSALRDSTMGNKQEEFLPDVPSPADSMSINQTDSSGIKRRGLGKTTKVDSAKVKNDILKQPGKQVNIKNNQPGTIDSTNIKKKFSPVENKILNKTLAPKDSLSADKNKAQVDSSAVKKLVVPVDSIKVIKPVNAVDTSNVKKNVSVIDTTKINSPGPK
jgi:hypothetical protein